MTKFIGSLRHGLFALALALVSIATFIPALAPLPAEAAVSISTAGRNAELSALVTQLGANATAKFYNGTRPASLGTPAGALLATVTFGATSVTDANGGTAGGVSGGVLTFGGFTQTSSGFTAGTPTFVRFSTSGGTAVIDIDIGAGAGNLAFTGTIATGQNITGTLTLTAGNP